MTTDTNTQIPVRLDFDSHAAAFSAAMARLDKAATKELDRVDFDPRLRELVRIEVASLGPARRKPHVADAIMR